jgi:hypothetical protein
LSLSTCLEMRNRGVVSDGLEAVTVARDGTWFRRGTTRVDLSRRLSLARLLRALVEQYLDGPQGRVTSSTLIAQAWPDERINPTSASTRLHTTIRRLRALGLEDVLLHRPSGYYLHRRCTISE